MGYMSRSDVRGIEQLVQERHERKFWELLWCHDCQGWQWAKSETDPELHDQVEDDDEWVCRSCGETIKCDECGQPWTNDHPDGESAHAEAAHAGTAAGTQPGAESSRSEGSIPSLPPAPFEKEEP